MKNTLITLFLSCAAISLSAQDVYPDSLAPNTSMEVDFAMEVAENLCSSQMAGRGYSNNGAGVNAAADYILTEYVNAGLQAVGGNYEQPVKITANTFPKRMEFQFGSNYLQPGIDFMIDPQSPSVSGTYHAIVITREELADAMTRMNKLRAARGGFLILDNNDRSSEKTRQQTQKIEEIIAQFKTDTQSGLKGVVICDTTNRSLRSWWTANKQSMRPIFYIFNPDVLQDISVVAQVHVEVDAELTQTYAKNIVGYIKGEVQPDSVIIICTHYDHVGQMGQGYNFPGANVGASGIATMLALAKHFSVMKPACSMLFIAFAGNEICEVDQGRSRQLYPGTLAYLRYPAIDLKKTKLVLAFDMMGNGYDGINIWNGNSYPQIVGQLEKWSRQYKYVPKVVAKRNARLSEHYIFKEKFTEILPDRDIPCLFIYSTGGSYAYKSMMDKVSMTPFTKFKEMQSLFIRFLEKYK